MESNMKVVIGYDGSPSSQEMIRDLKQTGLSIPVQAAVLAVADIFVPPIPDVETPVQIKSMIEKSRARGLETLRMAQSSAELGAQEIEDAMPQWQVKAEYCADSPAWGLIKKADEWKADLIVVGAHGHSKLGRFLGSVSQMVLAHASQSVRISRARAYLVSDKIKLLIGVDGSEGAKAAIDVVLNRNWPANTEVRLFSVLEPKMSAIMRAITPADILWVLEKSDDERIAMGHILEFYSKKLKDKGLLVTSRVTTGDPKKLLVDEAESWGADTIFLGARGLSNLKRFMIGGVSAAVAARAHCSVEVVRK